MLGYPLSLSKTWWFSEERRMSVNIPSPYLRSAPTARH